MIFTLPNFYLGFTFIKYTENEYKEMFTRLSLATLTFTDLNILLMVIIPCFFLVKKLDKRILKATVYKYIS